MQPVNASSHYHSERGSLSIPIKGFEKASDGNILTGMNDLEEMDLFRWNVQTIRVNTAEVLEHRLKTEFRMPKRIFSAEDIRLKSLKPVAIRVRKGEELWFAENDRLDIYATGDSVEDAVKEFSVCLVHFYLHYKDLGPQDAIGEAKKLKALFIDEFSEVD
jgi:hypothetical protein